MSHNVCILVLYGPPEQSELPGLSYRLPVTQACILRVHVQCSSTRGSLTKCWSVNLLVVYKLNSSPRMVWFQYVIR